MSVRKKIALIVVLIFCITLMSSNFYAVGYGNYNIVVDNNFIDKAYTVLDLDGILYLPLEPLQESLDLQIYRTSELTEIHFDGKILIVDNQKQKAVLNNNPIIMDYQLIFEDKITYIPLIYIIDIMNYKLEVLTEIKHIRIIYKEDTMLAGEIINNYMLDAEKKAEQERIAEQEKKAEQERITAEEQKQKEKQQTNETTSTNKVKDKEKSNSCKVAYLTFDDGIDKKITPQILDVLKKYNVKATFFILGSTVEKNKDIIIRMVQEGHSIGNHTYTHKQELIYKDVKGFKEELKKTSDIIYEVTKKEIKLFRPPYGASYIKSEEYKNALQGYKTVLWNIDSQDSSSRTISSEDILKNVVNQVKGKSSAIIIMHDSSTHKETLKALPQIIEYLIENGFSIKEIEDNTSLRYEF